MDDPDRSSRQKALAAVPIVLTILATIFAGMSSSEMTRSMYYRSLAGQYQSKAGSQWGFFQAKKMRGATLEAASDLTLLFPVSHFDEKTIKALSSAIDNEQFASFGPNHSTPGFAKVLRKLLDSAETKAAIQRLNATELPTIELKTVDDPALAELLTAIRSRVPESRTGELVQKITQSQVDSAIEAAEANADAFDQACQPTVNAIRLLETPIAELHRSRSGLSPSLTAAINDATVALRFALQDFTARRYDREAKFNQQIGELYEVQVRRAGFESERHRIRSKNFFYAMLCAQAGVTIASLALAKSKQSAFWLMAALAGLMAIGIGAYVYLAM